MTTILSEYSQFILPSIALLFILIIAVSVYYFGKKQKVIRILSKLPMNRIGSLKTNEFSKITGKALHVKEPLIAPYSNRKCIFYTLKIEHKKSNGKSSHWKTIVNEERIQDFFIEKNGDFVIVSPTQNPKNYISYLVIDQKANSGTFNDPSPKFNSLLKSYNIKSENFFGFNKTLRYTEGIIEIGEEVTVAGIVKWKNLKEPIEGYSYSKIAALESTDEQKIIITDLPHIPSRKRN